MTTTPPAVGFLEVEFHAEAGQEYRVHVEGSNVSGTFHVTEDDVAGEHLTDWAVLRQEHAVHDFTLRAEDTGPRRLLLAGEGCMSAPSVVVFHMDAARPVAAAFG